MLSLINTLTDHIPSESQGSKQINTQKQQFSYLNMKLNLEWAE